MTLFDFICVFLEVRLLPDAGSINLLIINSLGCCWQQGGNKVLITNDLIR